MEAEDRRVQEDGYRGRSVNGTEELRQEEEEVQET